MSSPLLSEPSTPGLSVNGSSLPVRDPKLFASDGHSISGSGTPVGFQRYHNKHLDAVAASTVRHPSPHATHLGLPGGGMHRILSEEDPGYIAAKFEGKQKQMEQGEFYFLIF